MYRYFNAVGKARYWLMGSDQLDEKILAIGKDPKKLQSFLQFSGLEEDVVKERIRLVERSHRKKWIRRWLGKQLKLH